jgi:hypothetical protein
MAKMGERRRRSNNKKKTSNAEAKPINGCPKIEIHYLAKL